MMFPPGWILILFFIFLTVIVIAACIILFVLSSIKKDDEKKPAKNALKLIGISIAVIILLCVIEWLKLIHFDNIDRLQVNGNKVTVLNYGTGSMGSDAYSFVSNPKLVFVDAAKTYHYASRYLFGYTYTVKEVGSFYVAVIEVDCGYPAYADIVKITSDGTNVTAEYVEHMDVYDGNAKSLTDVIDCLVLKYGFSENELKDRFEYYLELRNSNTE